MRNSPSSSGSIFDRFFEDDYRTIRKRVATSPLKVKVNPLPAGSLRHSEEAWVISEYPRV